SKVVGGIIGQAARSLARKAAAIARGRPRGRTGLGVDGAAARFQLAHDAAKDPAGFAAWLKCAAACTMELGSQAARNAIAGTPKLSALHRLVASNWLGRLLKHGVSPATFAKAAPRHHKPSDGSAR
ncbi:MAG: hypothetical protein ACREDV_06635, partial [Methylocella sp.]